LDRRAGVLAASAATFRAVHVALRRTAECAPLRAALAGAGAGAALPFEVRYCTHACLNSLHADCRLSNLYFLTKVRTHVPHTCWLTHQALYSVLGDAVGRPSLVVPLMPIQLQPGPVDCGLGEARGEARSNSGLGEARGEAHAGAVGAGRALEQCLTAVRRATALG